MQKVLKKILKRRETEEIKEEVARILCSEHTVAEEYLIWYEDSLKRIKEFDKQWRRALVSDTVSAVSFLKFFILILECYLNINNPLSIKADNLDVGLLLAATGVAGFDIKKYLIERKELRKSTPGFPFLGAGRYRGNKKAIKRYVEQTKDYILSGEYKQ